MAYPAWPSCLPLPQRESYAVAMGDALNARDTSGPVIARNRFTRAAENIAVQLVMNGIQLGILEAWFKHVVMNGAAWFTTSMAGETGLATHTVRMDGGYAATAQGSAWRVTFALLVDAPPEGV